MELPTPKRDLLFQQLLMVLAFSIPWAKKALPTLIAIILLVAILQFMRRKKTYRPVALLSPLGLISLFLLLLTGTCYTEHPVEAWNEVGIKLSLLLFPLLTVFIPNLSQDDKRSIHKSFIAGCFVFMIITLVRAGYNAYEHHHLYYLTYDQLSWYMHPTYAACYQAMALFLLGEDAMKKQLHSRRISLHVIGCLITVVFIGLLSSKAGYLSVLLILGFMLWRANQLKFSVLKAGAMAVACVAFLAVTIFALPTTSGRVEKAMSDMGVSNTGQASPQDTTMVASHTSSTQLRPVTWGASWTLLSENAFGTGTGDTQPQLNALYRQRKEFYAEERQLNAHNQYLQTGAELGWFGLAALLICLGALMYIGRTIPTAMVFASLCAFNFLFESFLEVQAGIVFFCFWVLVYSKTER